MTTTYKRRIVLINSIVERNDAISASVRDMVGILSAAGHEVTLLCGKCDYDDMPAVLVDSVMDLLLQKCFLDAELIIWHFGIWSELFNAVMIGNGHARQVVCFHNVTPKRFVPESGWHNIDRSLRQAHLLSWVDEVWPVSELNAKTAIELGVEAKAIHTIPLQVDQPTPFRLEDKARDRIELLYVGRFVKAKGADDLLKAISLLRNTCSVPFMLTLAGNITFSDAAFYQNLQNFVRENELDDVVSFVGTVSDETLWTLYHRSHLLTIPSYHEGFCKPIIEGLRAGCIPVGYDSYNIPYIVGELGRLVAPGDVPALAGAMSSLIEDLAEGLIAPDEAILSLNEGKMSVATLAARSADFTTQFTRVNTAARIQQRLEYLLKISAKDIK